MSLDEYNRHSILGSFAGPATTVSSIAGQDAYRRNNETPVYTAHDGDTTDYKPVLKTFAALIIVGSVCGGASFILPEALAMLTMGIAGLCALGIFILSLHIGFGLATLGATWAIKQFFNNGWWWVLGLPFTAFMATSIYAWHPFFIFGTTFLCATATLGIKFRKLFKK
jgi:hypothetical protein